MLTILSLLNGLLFLFSSYACSDGRTIIVEHSLIAQSDKLAFGSSAATKTIEFTTDQEQLSTAVASQGDSWCEARIENNALSVEVKDNENKTARTTIVSVHAGNHRQDIIVEQEGYGFRDDALVKAVRATATSEIVGEDGGSSHLAAYLIDGDYTTYHNSKVGEVTEWPFYYDFYFEGENRIDYLVCVPRQDSGNQWGAIGELELWIATTEKPELTKLGDFDLKQTLSTSSKITFDEAIINATHIQFRIKSGYNNRVSCAEVEFCTNTKSESYNYLEVFTDGSCSVLKSGITVNEINAIPDLFYKKIAQAIYNNTYESEYRIQDYRPYQHPDIMAEINKNKKYSLRDNPTGICINDPSEKLIVFVGDLKGQSPTLQIRDFQTNNSLTYILNEGLNVIAPGSTGLLYVLNHTEEGIPLLLETEADREKAAKKTVRIHIATGEINGLFDLTKHTNADWAETLKKYGVHTEIDVIGKYAHVVWNLQDYKDYNTDMTKMATYYDRIVHDQHEFMGLFYYNRPFRNRMFICVNYSVLAAAASDYWTYYNQSGYKDVFCTEASFLRRMWVLGHEVGHTNQVTPGVKWAGMTEVTNNLYAMYNQKQILGEAERMNNSDGYAAGFANIIDAEAPLTVPANVGNNDHMLKLPPFWQLKLYFIDILGQEHFYHDLFEHYRTTDNLDQNALGDSYHGMLQLDFVRQVCRIGKMDMTDFFTKWGFLRPVDKVINDYGNKVMKITQKQIDELIAEIKAWGYPEPSFEVHTLTDSNYKNYIQ